MTQDVAAAIAQLQQQVAANGGAEQSAITLLNGLVAQINSIAQNATEPDVVAALNALGSTITSNTASLAAAVASDSSATTTTTTAAPTTTSTTAADTTTTTTVAGS